MNSLQCNHTTHRIRLQVIFAAIFEKLAGVCAGGYPFLSLSYSFLFFAFLSFVSKPAAFWQKATAFSTNAAALLKKTRARFFSKKSGNTDYSLC